jgi:hypothetical protein
MVFLLLLVIISGTACAQDEVEVIEAPAQEWQSEEGSGFQPVGQPAPVPVRSLPPAKVNELKNDDDYWYANLERKKQAARRQQESSRGGGGLDSLLWFIILGAFAAAVIWYLASSNIGLFRRESSRIANEESDEELTDDIFAINYEKEIARAVAAGNFRGAIRFWYLRTLKEMSDRNIIAYQHQKTNHDYLNSLYGSAYYKPFFQLTRHFEYTWYGQFALSAEGYQLMQSDFSTFKAGLNG